MAETAPHTNPVKRTLVALVAVFALLQLAGTNDLLSNLTRPVVVGLLKLLGVVVLDDSGGLVLGPMHVPWTRDCAGVNILTMLWAVTLWANRAEPFSRRYWLRLALAAPAALVANIARIFTLLAYRNAFFPAVESPQLHYFIGFLWVIPCLPFFVRRAGREPARYLMETLFLVVALSLVSPFVLAPGGNLVTIATLLLLAQSQYAPLRAERKLAAMLWVVAAGFIAMASMESLWLPWLLLCPWFMDLDVRRSPAKLLLVLGSIPLVAMHGVALWLVVGAVLCELWRLFKSGSVERTATAARAASGLWLKTFARFALALLLAFPFIASSASGLLQPSLRPPAGAMSRMLSVNTYEVRLFGQPRDVQLMWYAPSGDGRHHTLPVCMRYRGIELIPSGVEPSVMTDGKVWMKEFFLHSGELVGDYKTYLQWTLWPWSAAGIHVIAIAPKGSMSAQAFSRQAEVLAQELRALGEPLRYTSAS